MGADPGTLYEHGRRFLFDMGPYYLTTLVQLLGPARCITAMGRTAGRNWAITSEPHGPDDRRRGAPRT